MAGRILGWLLVALALLAAGGDLVRSLERGTPALLALGDTWTGLSARSLDGMRSALLGVHPGLWDPAATWLLRQPAAVVALVLGAAILFLFRPRERRRVRPTFPTR